MMARWAGKVAVITGVSSGIGEEITKALVIEGVKVVGLARRLQRLQDLSKKVNTADFFPIECDVRNEEQIIKAFQCVEKKFDTPTKEYCRIIDTNVIAPAICAREASKSMRKRNVGGHIVNINSIAGHFAHALHTPIGMYGVSKYGVTAMSAELRHEMIAENLKIKVTSVSPGLVNTEMTEEFIEEESRKTILQPKDIAGAVMYALGTPEHVEIAEVTVIPHGIPIEGPFKTTRSYTIW
ncbi:farnesol dehydrogenase isoform X6 [Megachile rotundata]|uniref:farnesol dehydrogenase isoform X6 n=1 Tax=Megachile rotundata TaxID=143995 RepID=UPI003FD152E7